MFTSQSALRMRRSLALVVAVILAVWTMAFGLGNRLSIVSADQLTARSITMENSAANQDDVRYTFTFTASTTTISGLVIDFCSDSPIIGDDCTAPVGFDTNYGSTPTVASAQFANLTIDAVNSTASTLMLDSTGNNSNATVTITYGAGSGAAGVDNPTSAGSFYARIITYDLNSGNDGYVDTAPGTYIDEGGIALAATTSIAVSARVQEILQFCAGDTYADPWNCASGMSGSTVYIGVLDPTDSAITEAGAGQYAYVAMSTNALNGANISYVGETLESGANSITVIGGSEDTPTADTEWFGVDIDPAQIDTHGTTTALSLDAEFNTADDFTFTGDQYTADTIATASDPVNLESIRFIFGGDASMTTETGIYTTSVNFIGTGLF